MLVDVRLGASADAGSIPAASIPAIAAQLQLLTQASPHLATLVRSELRMPRQEQTRVRRPRSRRYTAGSCRFANGREADEARRRRDHSRAGNGSRTHAAADAERARG